MRQQSLLLGLIVAIIATAGTAIVLVSFQLKNDSIGTNAIAAPEVQPPLRQEEEPIQTSNQAENSQSTSATPDAIASSRTGNNESANDSASSTSTTAESSEPEIVTIVNESKPATVDGRVMQGEYAVKQLIGDINLELFWSIPPVEEGEKSVIYLALRSPVAGCVGISLDPSGPRLKGGDVLLGFVRMDVETDEPHFFIRDDYANQETGHSSDEELTLNVESGSADEGEGHYGKSDILESWGTINSNGGTTIEFSRYLDTGDNAYDKPIKSDPVLMRVQLAYSDSPEYNCFTTGQMVQKRINFLTGEVQDELQA